MPDLGWLTQPAVFPWVALAAGLCIGSFLNVVIHRLPRMMEREWLDDIPSAIEESVLLKGISDATRLAGELRDLTKDKLDKRYGIAVPRSRCPSCGHQISALQNIPLVSYALLRGKCASCGARIGLRYPVVELLAGIAAWYGASRYGPTMQALAAIVFVWAVIALAFIDQDWGILPDDITLSLLWFGLLVNLSGTFVPLREAVIGAAAGYLSLWAVNATFKLIRGVDGMGMGDFKMTAAVGAYLGWKVLFLVITMSAIVGAVFGLVQMVAARRGWDGMFKFHFGPYIAMAGVVVLFWGKEITTRFPAFKIY